jgi:glycosyltransferase involved in cell wall biosynthesis
MTEMFPENTTMSNGAMDGTHLPHGEPAPPHHEVRLSVVIPVYNERNTLAEILRRVRATPMAKEIILVDDGSTDGTRELLADMTSEPDLRILFHPENRGKGAALKTGFLAATGAIVLVQDADLEYDPADYPALLAPILANQADVVFGSRFLDRAARRGQSFWHALGNRALTLLSNMFTGLPLTDMETCYKVFRKDIIQAIAPTLKQNRFGIEPELTAKVARGKYRLVEVGVRYNARSYREGKKIGWRDGINAVWCILRYWRRD